MTIEWKTTTRADVAFLSGAYIGETDVGKAALAEAVSVAMGSRPTKPTRIFYYGKPDDYLSAKFGIRGNGVKK